MREPHMIEIDGLPLPTPVNRQWRQGRWGGTYLTAEARRRRQAIVDAIHAALGGPPEPISGAVRVELTWWPRDGRVADVDAYVKGALDALQTAAVYADDAQVEQLLVERVQLRRKGGAMRVRVIELMA